MRFIDLITLKVKAGKGGDGVVAFRRELYVAKGGPSGGDGGDGGNIIFVGDSGLNTLLELRKKQEIIAGDGKNGAAKNMHGRRGLNTYVKVPLGTMIKDENSKQVIGDIISHGQEVIIARGGRGGRGNARFASAVNRAPKTCENGMPGEKLTIICELKLLANAGLIGLPNVGKSTLLRAVSASTPTVANYPFTTLNPHLGVVKVNSDDTFVLADLPGLIAGASLGKGLGLQFLRHIERCQVLVHILDISDESQDHFLNYQLIMTELGNYDAKLLTKPQIIVANKIDLLSNDASLKKLQAQLAVTVYAISAHNKAHLQPLLVAINKQVQTQKLVAKDADNIEDDHLVYEYVSKEKAPEIIIKRLASNRFEISGETIALLYHKNPLNNYHNILLFKIKLQDLGVFDQLRQQGIKKNDHVLVYDFEFIWEADYK